VLNTRHHASPRVTSTFEEMGLHTTSERGPDGELLQLTETSRYRQIGPGF
jgi:hypothetical protein